MGLFGEWNWRKEKGLVDGVLVGSDNSGWWWLVKVRYEDDGGW